MSHRWLALWIFGPIGAGKSRVIERMPVADFVRVDQDMELETQLRAAGLPLDTRQHDAAQREAFLQLRKTIIAELWRQVPDWRAQGCDLIFETTGNKPSLFRAEVEKAQACGYRSLGCALRVPLAVCLERNQGRERVLDDTVVEASWRDFERALADGTYAEIFAGDRLVICEEAERAAEAVEAWLREMSPRPQ